MNPRRSRALRLAAAGVALLAAALSGPAAAQVTDTTQVPVDSVVVTPEADPTIMDAPAPVIQPISPRSAFIRSLVVPGWGQSAFGSYTRGGVYFAGWAGNLFMVFRNQVRLNEARGRFDRRVAQLEATLITGSEDPDSMRTALAEDPTILQEAILADDAPGHTAANLRKVVSSREQQREDWLALAIFWLLASGIDAYVTAHLHDLPTDIEVRRNADRSVSVGVDVPLPARRP